MIRDDTFLAESSSSILLVGVLLVGVWASVRFGSLRFLPSFRVHSLNPALTSC